MAAQWVWMRHEVHHGVARFPVGVVGQYQALGWQPCDEPAELDPSEDPRFVDVAPTPEPTQAAPEPAAIPKPPTAKPVGDPKKE